VIVPVKVRDGDSAIIAPGLNISRGQGGRWNMLKFSQEWTNP
jgi:hypothetical protein